MTFTTKEQPMHPTSTAVPAPTPRHRMIWTAALDGITSWSETHGRLPRRRTEDPEEYRLANWLNVQRANHRAGKLHPDYVAALEAVPGAFETRRTRTHREWAADIADFHAVHGRRPEPTAADPEERPMGHYLSSRLRPGLAAGKISTEDCAPLAAVPGALAPTRTRTSSDSYLLQLRAHVAATGQMPGWKENRPLARWVRRVLTSTVGDHIHTFRTEVIGLQESAGKDR